jgi:SAM-dependent methyltransferase
VKEEEIRQRSVLNRYLELVAEDVCTIFKDGSLFSPVDCPACGGGNHELQFEKLGFSYVLCKDCGTLFVNPRPPAELLMDYYTDSPSATFWVNSFFKPVAEVRREKIFRPRAEFVRDEFPQISGGVIGDIGAGFGIFLEELGKFWPDARLTAIEPSGEMADICRDKGLEVIHCGIEDITGRNGTFDLLTSFELMEHLHTPADGIRKALSLLKPGGYLMLTTLNGEGFDIQILWEKSKSVTPPHHINFFNPGSLALLLEKCGFTVVKTDTPGQLDWDIVEGVYRNENTDPGRLWRTFAERATPAAKESLQDWITKSGFSSHMRTIARKPTGR